MVTVAVRVTLRGWEALDASQPPLLTMLNRVGGRMETGRASYAPELRSGYLRIDAPALPGMDLGRLAQDCSKAVEAVFDAQGIRSGWSLCVVDDQGRTHWPER